MIRSQEPDSTGKVFVLPFEYVSAMSRDLSYDEVHAAKLDSLGSIIFARNRYMLVIGILRDDYFVN
jgi:hypothetical protein